MRKIKMVESEYLSDDVYSMKLFKKNIAGDVLSYDTAYNDRFTKLKSKL